MPRATIGNDVPTIRVRNTDMPSVRTRYSGILSTTPGSSGTNFAGKGYLIGMLGLTYSKVQNIGFIASSTVFKSDDVPTVRVRNTD